MKNFTFKHIFNLGDLETKMKSCNETIKDKCANPDGDVFITGDGATVLGVNKKGGELFKAMRKCKDALDAYRCQTKNI